MMIRSILVGLDGSAHSHAAVELGIRWAKQYDALLVGLGIIDEPTNRGSEAVPLGAGSYKEHRDEVLLSLSHRAIDQLLEGFALKCAEAGVACKVLECVGHPPDRICLEAQRYDLILLGKQTHYRYESQNQPDETLRKVLRNCPRPVVAVPEQLGKGDSVLIAYDGSLQAARTLQMFQSLRPNLAGEVHVVAVHSDHDEAVRHADRAIEYLGFHDIKARRHTAASSDPARTIIEHVSRLGAGLVVMGAYGQSVIREFFFGSTTCTMLEDKTVPLFLYH